MLTSCFIPFNEHNPYQPELAAKLADCRFLVKKRRMVGGLLRDVLRGGEQVDIVHLHWLPSLHSGFRGAMQVRLFMARLRCLLLLRKKIVWTVHNLYSHESSNQEREKWLVREVLKVASKVIVHTASSRRLLVEEFGECAEGQLKVIPHGNYIGVYPNEVTQDNARSQLNLPQSSRILLFFGHIRPYKGVSQLIAAFREIDDPNAILVIAGKPLNESMAEEIRSLAVEDPRIVLFLKMIPDEEAQIFLNAADVVVFPYQQILTSGALILAMSFGKACLAPRLGAIAETVDENQGGILYDAAEEIGLETALRKALNEEADVSAMGAYNLEAAAQWGWAGIAEQTAHAYHEALAD